MNEGQFAGHRLDNASRLLDTAGGLLDLDDHRVSGERSGVAPLEFGDLGLDGAGVLGFHDVDQFDLFLEALDGLFLEVLDEGDSALGTDDPPLLDAVLVESDHGLAGEVPLDLGPAEQEEPDVGVGDDVGDDLLEAEVFRLAGPGDSGSAIADGLLIEVRPAGHDCDGILWVPGVEVSLDDWPPACW